jgi:glycosyltransferase involved in cell wall biosynthesis
MKALHILEATEGGTRRHVLDLLPALQDRGVRCALVYSAERNPDFRRDAAFLQSKNIETNEIPMGHRWARSGDGEALRVLHAHLKAHRYDVIHCHSSNAGLLGRLANTFQKQKAPLVYTPHYVAFAAGLPRLQRRVALYLEKLLSPQSSHTVAVSQHEYSLLRRVLNIESRRISLIHNGIGAWPLRNPQSEIRNPKSEIGCFGRLTAQKNQSTLIRALPAIARTIPDVRLKLVGSGEDESTLRALAASLGCDDRVDFRGEVRDPYTEYFGCDIVAQPSRWEGCSYAILEAMTAGRAVVASTAGGNGEVLGAAGVLLPARDVAAWAREITALAHDAARREALGEAARERVAAHLSLDKMVGKTAGVYERVLREARPQMA